MNASAFTYFSHSTVPVQLSGTKYSIFSVSGFWGQDSVNPAPHHFQTETPSGSNGAVSISIRTSQLTKVLPTIVILPSFFSLPE